MKPKVAILQADGINRDDVLQYAFEKAGAVAEYVHINDVKENKNLLNKYQVLGVPGGFSYGDDVASGKILAIEMLALLSSELEKFYQKEKLIIGVCNGFQVLIRTGLLPFGTIGKMDATLINNSHGKFECRWVPAVFEDSVCVFTKGLSGILQLPIAHGEGKFFADDAILQKIEDQKQVALRYGVEKGKFENSFPDNPNGSLHGIVGISDPTGRVFGLMPHPEVWVDFFQYPNWRREKIKKPQGLGMFENAVKFFS